MSAGFDKDLPEATPKTWYVRAKFAHEARYGGYENEEKLKAFDRWFENTLAQAWQECANKAYDLGYLNEAQLLDMHEKKPKEWNL